MHTVNPTCAHCDMIGRRVPPWWRRVAFAGTKQVYHASPKPVIYIVPAQSILGRLPLVPVGEPEHGTIPSESSLSANSSAFKRGKCDEQGRPGTGSNLFYINSWAIIWPSDHPLPKKEDC